MTLLMDTPYLEQLKLSSERLQDIIPSVNPFATYTMGAETAPPSIQGVPQNYFDPMTGQFMMPDLQLGATTSADGDITKSYGTYTPAPFGASATNEVIPGLMSNAMTGRQGGGRNSMRPGVSTEFLGNTGLRINEDGTVTKLDPTSLDYKFNSFMNNALKYTPSGLLSNALNPATTFDLMKRVQDNYGVETAMQFRDAAFDTQNPATTDAVEGTGSGAVGSTGPTARGGRDNRGGIGDRNAPGGSVAAGANRGGAAGARG